MMESASAPAIHECFDFTGARWTEGSSVSSCLTAAVFLVLRVTQIIGKGWLCDLVSWTLREPE